MSDPETYSKFYAAFAKLDVKISSLGRYGYGWPTLVVEGIDRPDGPTAYIMDYQCCRYYDLFPTDGNRQGTYCLYVRLKFLTHFMAHSPCGGEDREVLGCPGGISDAYHTPSAH